MAPNIRSNEIYFGTVFAQDECREPKNSKRITTTTTTSLKMIPKLTFSIIIIFIVANPLVLGRVMIDRYKNTDSQPICDLNNLDINYVDCCTRGIFFLIFFVIISSIPEILNALFTSSFKSSKPRSNKNRTRSGKTASKNPLRPKINDCSSAPKDSSNTRELESNVSEMSLPLKKTDTHQSETSTHQPKTSVDQSETSAHSSETSVHQVKSNLYNPDNRIGSVNYTKTPQKGPSVAAATSTTTQNVEGQGSPLKGMDMMTTPPRVKIPETGMSPISPCLITESNIEEHAKSFLLDAISIYLCQKNNKEELCDFFTIQQKDLQHPLNLFKENPSWDGLTIEGILTLKEHLRATFRNKNGIGKSFLDILLFDLQKLSQLSIPGFFEEINKRIIEWGTVLMRFVSNFIVLNNHSINDTYEKHAFKVLGRYLNDQEEKLFKALDVLLLRNDVTEMDGFFSYLHRSLPEASFDELTQRVETEKKERSSSITQDFVILLKEKYVSVFVVKEGFNFNFMCYLLDSHFKPGRSLMKYKGSVKTSLSQWRGILMVKYQEFMKQQVKPSKPIAIRRIRSIDFSDIPGKAKEIHETINGVEFSPLQIETND